MASPIKRVLFFLIAAMVLRASPALSVPLALDAQGSSAYGADYVATGPDGTPMDDGSATVTQDPSQVASGPRADDAEVMAAHPEFGMSGQNAMTASGSSHMPGWLIPAGAVGAGGAMFALLAHGHHGNGNSDPAGLGSGSSDPPGASLGGTSNGNDPPGDNPPSTVPEPGTLALMGLGIASFLGRRRLVKK